MSDKIGVLGSAVVATAATTTVYTVPSGKAAKCQIMWHGESHASTSTGDLTITVNGIPVATVLNITAANEVFSNSTLMVSAEAATATGATGATALLTVAPAPFVYYLSAADTITYTIGTLTMVSMNMQVVGTEIDV
tara:strand:+ start:151 stop:558 length:408 start_codon:yes stop_codon:yes gene_type:complete